MDAENSELIRLRQENSDLVAKLASMKSQIDMTNVVSAQLETVCAKNISLEKEIRDIQGKYDDLAKRLKISVDRNNELQSQLESIQFQGNSNASKEVENLKNNIIGLQKTINELRNNNQTLEQKVEKSTQDLNESKEITSSILSAAENYFETKISNPEALKFRFSQKEEPKTNTIVEASSNSSEYEIIALCQEIKKFKKINRRLLADKDGLIHDIQLQEQKNKDVLDSTTRQFQNQISNLKLENEKQHVLIKELTTKNGELATAIANQKMQIITEQKGQTAQLKEEIHELETKLTERDSNIKQLTETNSNLKKEMSNLTNKYKSAQNASKLLKDELTEANRAKIEIKFNYDHALAKIEDLNQQLNSSESRYMSKESDFRGEEEKNKVLSSQLLQIKTENAKTIKILSDEQIKSNNQQIQIEKLTKDLETAKTFGNEQSNIVNNLTKQIQQLSEQISKMEKEEKERRLRAATEERRQLQAQTESISPQVFENKDLPQELQTLISDITKNQTLRVQAKMKNILTVVVQWYNKAISYKNNELETKQNQYKQIHEKFELVLDVLTRNLGIEMSLDDLIKSEQGLTTITNTLVEKGYQIQEEKKIDDQKEKIVLEILSILGARNEEDAITIIQQMMDEIQALHANIKDIRKQNKSIIKASKQRDEECIAKLSELENEATEISERAMRLESENKSLESKIKELQDQLTQEQEDHSREMKTMAESHALQIEECEKAVKKANERAREEIQKRADVEEYLRQESVEKEKIQRSLQLMHSSKKKYADEVAKTQQQIKEIELTSQERIKAERQTITTRFEAIIAQLKDQNGEYQASSEKMKQKINQQNDEISDLNEEIKLLSLDLQKVNMQLKSNEEQYKRELKLLENQLTTKMLFKEKELNDQLGVTKQQAESTKRALIGRIGIEFCSLFNTTEEINEENFEKFVVLLRQRFDSLISENTKLRSQLQMKPDI